MKPKPYHTPTTKQAKKNYTLNAPTMIALHDATAINMHEASTE